MIQKQIIYGIGGGTIIFISAYAFAFSVWVLGGGE